MNWTKEVPTAPGPYWVRGSGETKGGAEIVQLVSYGGKLRVINGDADFVHEYSLDCEWAGPIPEPTEGEIPKAPAPDAREALAKFLYYQSPEYDQTLWKNRRAIHLEEADAILVFLANEAAKRAPGDKDKGGGT